MSETLLRIIIKLFAIVAKEDDVTQEERAVMEEFLLDHLSRKKANLYLDRFNSQAQAIMDQGDEFDDEKEIERLCGSANAELTIEQKIVLLIYLIELILADGTISENENKYVSQIASIFRIDETRIDESKQFVLGESPEDFVITNILIIDNQDYDKTYHFKHWKKDDLNGRVIIYQVPNESLYFMKYSGAADMFLNGIAVKPGKIYVFSTGSNMRSDRMSSIYYSDILSRFIDKTEDRLSFEVDNLSFRFKAGNLGLRDISFSEESGKLIGIMGASGAGKSTLLHVLNGTEQPSEGQVLINGIDIHKNPEEIEGVIGFVPQDDLLMEDLSVYKNLYYAAKLCFSQLSEDDIDKLVSKTLKSLGLYEIRDLKVGSPLQKTISGGQRKRLNIGLELLREPSVLFLDEPTSGLSSRDSENIMDLLKELALKGKLIFVVIHQPSSDIFKMFDRLVILDVGGYPIFYGDPVAGVIYFKKQINLLNAEDGECVECGNVNPEQIFNIIETRVVNEFGRLTTERKISPEQWNELYRKNIDHSKVVRERSKPISSLNIPNFFKQFKVFLSRDLFSKLSNKQYLIINLLEAPLLAILLGSIVKYWSIDETSYDGYLFGKNINIPSYLFMAVIVALFMGLTVSAEEIIRDRKILKREAFLNLSRGSYLSSKLGLLFSLSAIQTLVFVLIGNTILGISGMYISHWLILFSVSCFANVLGLNISSAFNSAVTIYILIPVLLIPQLLLSGVVVKFDKINPHLSSEDKVPFVGDVMASRWGFEAAMVSQFRDNEYEQIFYELDKQIANAEYKKVYLIPRLETKLDLVRANYPAENDSVEEVVKGAFSLLQKEIRKELAIVGMKQFPNYTKLSVEEYSDGLYNEAVAFFDALKRYYTGKYNKAIDEKDNIIASMTDTPAKRKEYEYFRNSYHNTRISDVVKNVEETNRVAEVGGKLIRKIYPIYMDPPKPSFALDFRTQFYTPTKYFAGVYIDTLVFNILMIWFMSIVLMITLYFDLLRKLIDWFGNLKVRR